jgi:hypothetical protein
MYECSSATVHILCSVILSISAITGQENISKNRSSASP